MIRQLLTADPPYHLFGIAETHLSPDVDDVRLHVPGFSILRVDRNAHGGGILLYVRNSLKATLLARSDTTKQGRPGVPEYLLCSVQQGNFPSLFAAVIYRPPHIPFLAGSNFIEDLTTCSSEFSHKIIMGDLNANLLSSNEEALFVRRLADDLCLKIIEHGATHHVRESHTWIDVMLVDDNDIVLGESNEMATFASNHNVIGVVINIQATTNTKATPFYYRNFESVTPHELARHLVGLDWSTLTCPFSNVDEKLECVSSNLMHTIDITAPLKQFLPKGKNYPSWVGADLITVYKRRDSVRKRYRRTRDNRLWHEFRALATLAEQRTNEARDSHIRVRLSAALANKTNVWRELRVLGLLPQTREELHGFTPDELNAHFAGVSASQYVRGVGVEEVLDNACTGGFTFKVVSSADVILAVSHFSSQARGEDGIPQCIVARSLPVIAEHLACLCNASLSDCVFPGSWKRAHVVPLKKKSIPSSPSDFRPIALLSFLSKILEKIVHDQIIDYLTLHNILDPLQTGFRQHHSTQTALLKLTEDIRLGIDSKEQLLTILLLFDFSKAFDTISHGILLQRLRDLGFSRSALLWLCSYMTGRQQRVVTKSQNNSDWLFTNLGVPQGSVLGPLLFSLYINQLRDVLQDGIQHILYADDLQIYIQVPIDGLDEGIHRLSEAAHAVSSWATTSALHLNVDKTKAIIFGSNYNLNKVRGMNLAGIEVGNGVVIPFVSTVKNLGVTMDSKLTWKPQVDEIAKKVNRALYTLRFFRNSTTEILRKQLVEALIVPHLDYCSIVYLDLSRELQTRLQRLQNSCVRYICGVGREEHITPYREKLKWLDVNGRRTYFIYLMLYKIARMGQPPYLASFFLRCQTRTTGRGIMKEFLVPGSRTDSGFKSFKTQGARLWNSIPHAIRHLPSLWQFKAAIRRHLLLE